MLILLSQRAESFSESLDCKGFRGNLLMKPKPDLRLSFTQKPVVFLGLGTLLQADGARQFRARQDGAGWLRVDVTGEEG